MKTGDDARCTAGGDWVGTTLLAEFRTWLDQERGLSPVSVRCYCQQAKAFLTGVGGPEAVSGLDAAKVVAFMVDHTRDRNTWSAKAMVTSLRAFLRFAHATGRTAVPLAGAVPAVASWRLSGIPRGLQASEIERLLAGCERETAVGLRDYAVLSLLARLGLRGAEAAGLQLGDIDWRVGEVAVMGKGSRVERLPLPVLAGQALARWLTDGRPRCESRAVFVTVRRPYRQLTPDAVRQVMARACDRAGLNRRGAHRLRHALAPRCCVPARRCPRLGRCCGTAASFPPRCVPRSTRTRCARWRVSGPEPAGERAAGQSQRVPGHAPRWISLSLSLTAPAWTGTGRWGSGMDQGCT